MILIITILLFLPFVLGIPCNQTCREECRSYSSDLVCSLSCGCNYYDTKSDGRFYIIVAMSEQELQQASRTASCQYLEFLYCMSSVSSEQARYNCGEESQCKDLVMDLPISSLENQECLDSCAKECVNAGNPSLCLKDCVLARCNSLTSITASEFVTERPKSYGILLNGAIFFSIAGSVMAWFYCLHFTQRRYKYNPKPEVYVRL